MLLKKSSAGVVIFLLSSAGLLMFYLLKAFPRGASSFDALIVNKLMKAGLSRETAQMWAAVSRHETGDYKSNLAVNANNLFGMNFPVRRETTAINKTENGFAVYSSPSDSVSDLVLYMREFNYPDSFNSAADLVTYMRQKGYFTDAYETYLNGVVAAGKRAGFDFSPGIVKWR